jgi:hypothetical protein
MKYVAVLAALVFCFVGSAAPQNTPEPDLSTKRVESMVVGYSKEDRVGQIMFGEHENKVEQYFEIWGKSPKDIAPIQITYVLEKRDAKSRRFYTATWGKGPVERTAFNLSCLSEVPDFKDDAYWVAKVVDGKLQFELLDDIALKAGVIKVLFRSVKGSVQRWVFDTVRPVTSNAPYDDQRILIDMVNREENRKLWYTKGWLGPENRCVRYLQFK